MYDNIEDFNRQLTACRVLNEKMQREYITRLEPTLNHKLIERLQEYYKIAGTPSRYQAMRHFVKTRKFVRTINPKIS